MGIRLFDILRNQDTVERTSPVPAGNEIFMIQGGRLVHATLEKVFDDAASFGYLDPEVVNINYADFKALKGSYDTHQAYKVTDVANAVGLGAGTVFQFVTRDPDDRFIGGVVQGSSDPIVIDVTTETIFLQSNEKREVRGPIATVGMPRIVRDELAASEELVINNGETAVVIGPYTISGTVTTTGTGALHVVTGASRTLLVFNAAGLPIASVAKVEADGRLNLPVFAVDPVTTNDGDVWIRDAAGTTEISLKVGGVVKRVEVSL